MAAAPDIEALALCEIDGQPRAVRVHDAILKKAPVQVLACAPVSPGKMVVIFYGDVASVQMAFDEAKAVAGARLIDHMLLPGVHPEVAQVLRGERHPRNAEALGLIETSSLAAVLLAADAARKAAAVTLGRMHLGAGFGGRGTVTLFGDQSDVEAALEAGCAAAGDKLLDHELIAAPHDELEALVFKRPWPLDPAG